MNYLKRKAISFFDATDLNLSIFVNVGIGLITFFMTKLLGINGLVTMLICISTILLFGSIVQILRKDKNVKIMLFYIIGTLFSIFSTIMVWVLNKYSKTNNVAMVASMIKISICAIALLFDIPGVFYIVNKENPKGKKMILLLCMIYFTMLAVGAMLFFNQKGFAF